MALTALIASTALTTMILKGPGVQARSLVISHSFGVADAATPGGQRRAARAPEVPSGPSPEQLLVEAQRQLEQAQLEAAQLIRRTEAEAERLLGQAQVELGRARAEAEQLSARAAAQLVDAGEIITTAAEAREYLKACRDEGEALRTAAEAEVEAIRANAREEGFEEGRLAGYEDGMRQAREELALELELVHGIAAQAKVDRAEVIEAAEPEILRLAFAVARKIIAREVEVDPDILRGLLTRAMLKAAGDDPIRLQLNPATIERLGTYLQDLSSRFSSRGVQVVANPLVDEAGVIVESRTGTVDARTETQLTKIEGAVMSLVGE